MQRLGLPFLASLPLAFLAAALVGLVLERLIYRPMYAKSHLDQVMFSIGLVFMAVAGGPTMLMGSSQQFIRLPAWLQGRFESPASASAATASSSSLSAGC
jgi:branched-chain amino acid transport system permease protein